ncbi:MAG: FxsA family protein, partial [Gammaproteobacteria bacterium]|nr:FxsA family protein [Gemmatimonadota bacterium]NIU75882.1 FxsA family protein [Gammaproteobacteria bacterium]
MLFRLFLLFIGLPLVELALLIQLGQWVGLLPTIGLVVLTGVVGAALARSQGFQV